MKQLPNAKRTCTRKKEHLEEHKRNLSKSDLCKGCPVGQPRQEGTGGEAKAAASPDSSSPAALSSQGHRIEGMLGKWKSWDRGGKENTLKW